jgi:ActR/RegA family two-component response regulator
LKTVLILDDDLGFVFWLGHVLDAAAYSTLPAKSVPDAALLVTQLGLTVDVLAINLALAEGLDFIAAMHRSQKDMRVIGILNDPANAINIPGVNSVHLKPSIRNEEAKIEWLQYIQSVLANRATS